MIWINCRRHFRRIASGMTPETFRRHAERRIPRYTSYPTAPQFTAAFGETQWRERLATLAPDTPVSLYLHIPFCRAMCWYCGCHTTVTGWRAPVERYVAALVSEIELMAAALPDRLPVRHLHFGGGSPTLMSPADLAAVMATIREAFALGPDSETAIEIDPRAFDAEFAAALAEQGLSRASLGLQSFDPIVQRAINRVQTFEQTAHAVGLLRGHGVPSINFDLIYGLPNQTVSSCRETVARALDLRPDRFAVFGYAHVPAFKRHQRKIDDAALPNATERFAQAEAIADALGDAGYRRIGLDHYALPDDALARAAGDGRLHRNFQGYTTDACDVLLGFGASAISRTPGGYAQNSVLIADYQARIGERRLALTRGCALSADDVKRAAVIERLMCDYQVDFSRLDAEDLLETPGLAQLAADGLIERHGSRIQVRDEARPLVRAVAAAFDAYLDEGGGRHVCAV